MQDADSYPSTHASVIAAGEASVAVGGDNHGTINTGVIVNIHGDDIERSRDIARTILAATQIRRWTGHPHE